ncbi:MAG: PEP-CTERM sorting domain-containing protein [Planctomycetota bacterium]
MFRFALIATLSIALGLAFQSQLRGDEIIRFADIPGFEDEEYEWEFDFTEEVLSIDSITIELSHSNSSQVQIYLENVGIGFPYALFTLIEGDGTGTGNTIGADDGDFGDLNGLSELRFVKTGPSTTVRNAGDEAPSGDYLAEEWENFFGSGTPPYEPSRWRMTIIDNSSDGGHVGAIGILKINFTTAVPEPASMAVLLIGGVIVGIRRRRR